MNKLTGYLILFFTAVCLSPADTILLKKSDSIDFLEKMEAHDYFFKQISAIDVAGNEFYFLDDGLKTILRIDNRTGKLINAISSKGQGPFQLQFPCALRVKDNKVFVADMGFMGVKIYHPNGKGIREFKTGNLISHSSGLDVNARNEIFVKCKDPNAYPAIFVYNMEGKKIRTFITFPPEKRDRRLFILNDRFTFKLDSKENVAVLFLVKKLVRKYDKKGGLLWEREIKNEILDEWDTDPHWRFEKSGAVRLKTAIFGLDVDENDNIVVGHVGGGVVYNKAGELLHLIRFDPVSNLRGFRIYKNKLLHIVAMAYFINIYEFPIKSKK